MRRDPFSVSWVMLSTFSRFCSRNPAASLPCKFKGKLQEKGADLHLISTKYVPSYSFRKIRQTMLMVV